MRIVDTIALVVLPGEIPRSRIVVDGRHTDAMADGIVLEAAIERDGRFLLFVTDDVPFEEGLHIQLFDDRWNRIDRADLSWINTSGNFRDLTVIDDSCIAFAFFAEALILEFPDRPARSWFGCEASGVHRPFGGLRQFRLRPRDIPAR